MTSLVNFSDYSLYYSKSLSSPNHLTIQCMYCHYLTYHYYWLQYYQSHPFRPKQLYSTNLKTSSSGSINGFGNGSRMIQGCGEAKFYAQLPNPISSCRVCVTCQTPHQCSYQSLTFTKRIATPYSVTGGVLLSRTRRVANLSKMLLQKESNLHWHKGHWLTLPYWYTLLVEGVLILGNPIPYHCGVASELLKAGWGYWRSWDEEWGQHYWDPSSGPTHKDGSLERRYSTHYSSSPSFYYPPNVSPT